MPEFLLNILSSQAGVIALFTVAVLLLGIVWPAGAAFLLRLAPVVKQIPALIEAARGRDLPGHLKELDVIESVLDKAGPVEKVVVKAAGRAAVRRVVRAEAAKAGVRKGRGDIPRGGF